MGHRCTHQISHQGLHALMLARSPWLKQRNVQEIGLYHNLFQTESFSDTQTSELFSEYTIFVSIFKISFKEHKASCTCFAFLISRHWPTCTHQAGSLRDALAVYKVCNFWWGKGERENSIRRLLEGLTSCGIRGMAAITRVPGLESFQ